MRKEGRSKKDKTRKTTAQIAKDRGQGTYVRNSFVPRSFFNLHSVLCEISFSRRKKKTSSRCRDRPMTTISPFGIVIPLSFGRGAVPMDKNVGASFGLSVLIVVFFAVILYQPDNPAPTAAAVASVEPLEAHPPELSPTPPVASAARPATSNVARPVSVRSVEPRGPFTTVREGESLADVARRVYGRAGCVEVLWLANRDRLDRVDSPVTLGLDLTNALRERGQRPLRKKMMSPSLTM